MKLIQRIPWFATIAAGAILQAGAPSVHAEGGCSNIRFQGLANLGFIELGPGIFVLGALPTPTTIAGVSGMLGSIITGVETSGADGQGAWHFTLVHTFVSTEPSRPGTFFTSDRAISAPAGTDPNTGIINDVMTIVSGTGVFADAEGFMMNHAILNLNNFTLTTSVHGRICAKGL